MKKLLSIILTILMIVTTIPFAFAADCVHDYSGEHFCLGYYCGNCDSYYGEPNPNGHYWFGEQCGICYETHKHTGNAGTICMGTLCELCYYPYGEVTDPDAHNWNRSGTCGYCGAECEHPSYTDGLCNVCGYACPHDNSDEYFCLGYYCGNCNSYYGGPNPALHQWINHECVICKETHTGSGNAGTICLGTLCEICYYPYGEVTDPDAHRWNRDGTCGWCGAECEHPSYTDGLCDDCGKKCPHETYIDSVCDICGYECLHENQTGETCAVCGATLHTCDFTGEWKYDSEKHWKECSCGLIGEEGEHSWIFGKCTECGYACEHDFTNYEETEAPKCGVAGKEEAGCNNDCGAVNQREIPALTHKDDNGDGICDNDCGSEFAVIEGETYVVLGDITYTGVEYDCYAVSTLEPGCYKAGDGYVVIKTTDTGTELILDNATIDVREEAVSDDSSENDAVCVYGDLNVTFIGTTNIYAKEGYYAFHNTGSSAEDAQLVISGAEGAVLNLYGSLFGYYITVKSGTVNAYEDEPDTVFAIQADKYFTVEKDAVVTAVGADNELFPNISVISQRGMTVEGVLNAFTFEPLNAEEFSVALKVFGDITAQQDIDVSLAAQEGAAIDLVITEGASLTIPEGCTINLDSFNNVDIKGELIVNGTLICTHEGQNGSCKNCGENLGKLVIDVTDKSSVEIGNGYDYYDEDGYIITGTNQNASVNIIEETALTLSNLTLGELYFNNAPDDSVINITLDGTTEVTEYVSLYRAHLIFDGGETDIFKTPYFTTLGNSGSVTVNGGNIILDGVTEGSSPTIDCTGGFIINGGKVTASNNYSYVVGNSVTLNGGELNIINTAADREAILSDITMDKGTLLTVSTTGGILYRNANILKADGLVESDYFFVRYDTESEFVPVYDIRAALNGKTYAEIKIDTHEHSFENGKCVCGYECPHESYTDGVCDACGYVCTHEDGEGFDYENNGDGKHTFTCYICEFSGTADHIFENYTTVVNADCENNAWESGKCVCDATDRREIPDSALGHNPSGWWQKNETEHWRHCVNDSCSEEIEGTRAEHSYTWEVTVEATATTDGMEIGTCVCGYETTRVIPVTGETPDPEPGTPDEPTDDTCDHMCHKDGILGFLWKIISFFLRLFNIQQYCDCGQLHYDASVFG